jgi:hypothetical protein
MQIRHKSLRTPQKTLHPYYKEEPVNAVKGSSYYEENTKDIITFSEWNAEFVMFKYVVRIVTTVL